MRRLNLILFVIVVAIILFSVVRGIFGTSAQQKRPEPRRSPAATAQVPAETRMKMKSMRNKSVTNGVQNMSVPGSNDDGQKM